MERSTRQKAAIREALQQAGRPLLPAELLLHAQRAVPELGLATIYRNLKLLVAEGQAEPVHVPGDAPRYEWRQERAHDHHHHFRCRMCERVFDVHACPGDLRHLAPPGFAVDDHDITLYGRCEECAQVGAAKARMPRGSRTGLAIKASAAGTAALPKTKATAQRRARSA